MNESEFSCLYTKHAANSEQINERTNDQKLKLKLTLT